MTEKQAQELLAIMKEDVTDKKRERTFQYIERERHVLREFYEKIDKGAQIYIMNGEEYSPTEIRELLSHEQYRQAFYELTCYFEHLAYAVRTGYFEYDLVHNILYKVVPSLYNQLLKAYIEVRREETSTPTICSNMEWMVQNW